MTKAVNPDPAPSPSLAALRDFSDRIPPVVVRELRQALRSRLFVVPFLVLHGLLLLCCLFGTGGGSEFFWHCLDLMFVCLLPARSLGALSEERQANTLDTLLLTNLSSGRIVSGKWGATAALSALTAISVLPYLLVRCLNHSTSLVLEAGLLLALLMLSGSVAAVLTAFSAIRAPLLRHGVSAVLLVAVYAGMEPVVSAAVLRGQLPPWTSLAGAGFAALWVAAYSLVQAATVIAPAAVSLSGVRRLTTLVALLPACLLLGISGSGSPQLEAACVLVLMISSIVEMAEPVPVIPGRSRRNGLLLRAIFRPGWPSGVRFSLVLWGLLSGLAFVVLSPGRFHEWTAAAAACFFPVTLRCLLPSRFRSGILTSLVLIMITEVTFVILRLLLPADALALTRLLPALTNRESAGVHAVIWAASAAVLAAAASRRRAE